MAVLEGYLQSRPASERDAVMGGNAARFWRLPVEETIGTTGEKNA
jgi:hypothetical protein